MKRRWSNNGGFALRALEESSSEVTSSSALAPAAAMSPTSIDSSEYNDMDLWNYDDTSGFPQINTQTCGNNSNGGINAVGVMGNNSLQHLPNNIQNNTNNMTTFGSSLSSMQIDIRLNGSSNGRSRSSLHSISPGTIHY